MKLPKHVNLTIEHNPQAISYMTVQEWAECNYPKECDDSGWVSPEEKRKAFEANEVWAAQWYPITPVGSCVAYAATLEALLKYLAEVE